MVLLLLLLLLLMIMIIIMIIILLIIIMIMMIINLILIITIICIPTGTVLSPLSFLSSVYTLSCIRTAPRALSALGETAKQQTSDPVNQRFRRVRCVRCAIIDCRKHGVATKWGRGNAHRQAPTAQHPTPTPGQGQRSGGTTCLTLLV